LHRRDVPEGIEDQIFCDVQVPAINPIRITLPVALAIAAFYKRIGAAAMTGLLITVLLTRPSLLF